MSRSPAGRGCLVVLGLAARRQRRAPRAGDRPVTGGRHVGDHQPDVVAVRADRQEEVVAVGAEREGRRPRWAAGARRAAGPASSAAALCGSEPTCHCPSSRNTTTAKSTRVSSATPPPLPVPAPAHAAPLSASWQRSAPSGRGHLSGAGRPGGPVDPRRRALGWLPCGPTSSTTRSSPTSSPPCGTRRTDSPTFRRLADELVTLLAYEATRDVRVEPVEITTPVAPTTGVRLAAPEAAGGADPAGRARACSTA